MEEGVKPPRINSTYAIVDVMKGRHALARYLKANEGLPVTIHGVLIYPFGSDDGTSIEFCMDVSKIEVSP
jgi:hypothetical protein